jgi:cytochrome b subunit of formate dehydrogenase
MVDEPSASASATRRMMRHALVDRVFHWTAGASVLLLLATGFLPVLGLDFAWVTIHWISGLILTGLVIVHIIRAAVFQDLRSMWISGRDLRNGLRALRPRFSASSDGGKIDGKYSLAQKAIHHAFSIVVLTAIVTGFVMLVKIDTPLWRRDPYWLSDYAWGVVYVLHGFAALLLVTMVTLHIYFALRPEKLYLTRSMVVGWVTGEEYADHYESPRWALDRKHGKEVER